MGGDDGVSCTEIQIADGFRSAGGIATEMKLTTVAEVDGDGADAVGVVVACSDAIEEEPAAVEGEATGASSRSVGSAKCQGTLAHRSCAGVILRGLDDYRAATIDEGGADLDSVLPVKRLVVLKVICPPPPPKR